MSLEITNGEIDQAINIMFPEGAVFCDERRKFIRSLDSIDIQACPGSGKTTSLILKLMILSSKLPLPNNQGICVLAHTNVAINEIKHKFGLQLSSLFNYPNYVGTIQTFIDKFLAIPYYINLYGKRPVSIDNDQFSFEVNKNQGIKGFQNARYFFQQRQYLDLPSLRFSFENFIISKELNDEKAFIRQNTPTYTTVRDHKLEVMKKGYLCFDDAYALASQYLKQYPNICSLISKRFKYVFIDEMQDTDVHQIKIIDSIFPYTETIIQRLGDSNQAIYTYDVRKDLVWKQQNVSFINGSKRLSLPIAKAIKNIGVEPQELEGNPDHQKILPTLIVFEDKDISQVIPTFAQLITENDLQNKVNNPIFKAIGWVGKRNDQKHTIVDYWPTYSNQRKKNFMNRSSLEDYIDLQPGQKEAKYYMNPILDGIVRFLRINNIADNNGRFFTKITFKNFLENEQPNLSSELKLQLTKWVSLLYIGDNAFDKIHEFLINCLAKKIIKGFLPESPVNSKFFDRGNPKDYSPNNIAVFSEINTHISIDTIHGIKGETHTATLFLETFNEVYDVNSILDYFNPNIEKASLGIRQIRALKMAYVAMSRPTHLLCVAVHKNTAGRGGRQITNNPSDLQKKLVGVWKVIDLSNY